MESIDNIMLAHEDEPIASKVFQKEIVRMQTPNAFLEIVVLPQ